MDFLKKNYEKVLLAVVLLGLTIAVAMLPFIIQKKREELENTRIKTTNTKAKPLPELDMTRLNAARDRVAKPFTLDLTGRHNLFNPVLWQMTPEGRLIKVETGKEIGAGALEVTDISPLYLKVSFESTDPTGYLVKVIHEATRNRREYERIFLVSLDRKSDTLTLRKVGGTQDRPELDLELKGTGSNTNEFFTITPDKPYERIEGYEADLKYPLDSSPEMKNRRVNDIIRFGGGEYKIVEITSNAVRVQDKSNDKITLVHYKPPK